MTVADDELRRRDRLADAAQALGLALNQPTLDQLMAYLQLLQRWNRVDNLTALRDPDEMLSHHLIDCLAVERRCGRWWQFCPAAAPCASWTLAAAVACPAWCWLWSSLAGR